MASSTDDSKYPDRRQAKEARRLEIQGRLITESIGDKLLLCPVDLSKPGLRILDSATANGAFLHQLRGELAEPDTAELVGTDKFPFDTIGLPSNITLHTQDILQPWPADWAGSFDLVHQRAALMVTSTRARAVDAVHRLVGLVRPGGWIQIVEGCIVHGDIRADDAPDATMFKTMHACLMRFGIDSTIGGLLEGILAEAGKGMLQNMGSMTSKSICGKGASSDELEESGYEQVQGLHEAVVWMLRSMPEGERPFPLDEFEALLPDLMARAHEKGVVMDFSVAWAQRI